MHRLSNKLSAPVTSPARPLNNSSPSAVRVARPALLPAVPQPLLLLVSWLYGPAQWNSTCLPLFLRSVGASPTIRVAIVGDPSPPAHLLPMPSNVEFISLPWGTLCARLQTVLSASMHHVNGFDYRKITDMKPLTALLVPEVITPYAWWGWIDNDVRPARQPARVPLKHLVFVWLRVFCECVQSLPAHCDVPFSPPPCRSWCLGTCLRRSRGSWGRVAARPSGRCR